MVGLICFFVTSPWKVLWLIFGFFVFYIGYLILGAFLSVKTAPREEMFICDKHGPLRKQHVISFAGIESCPICFHERMKTVEGGRLPE